MGSGLVFDPIVLLRVTPLVSSTCTLLHGGEQDFFLGLLNRSPESRARSRALLPGYFDAFFRRGVGFVVGCLAVTTWSSVANLYFYSSSSSNGHRPVAAAVAGRRWYIAGAVLSAAHLLFVPLVAPPIKAIIDADKDKDKDKDKGEHADDDPNATLDTWLRINRIRTLTVDLAAWIASVGAVVSSLAA